MLENSNLIDGTQAKELNKLLTEYQGITAKLTDLDTTKKEVLKRIFELSQIGINETNKFVFNVVNNTGRESISLKSLREDYPDLFKKVSGAGLISIGENYKTIRGIKLKGDRV